MEPGTSPCETRATWSRYWIARTSRTPTTVLEPTANYQQWTSTEIGVQQRRSSIARTQWGGPAISYPRLAVGDILAPPRRAAMTARSIAPSIVLVCVLAAVLASGTNAGARRQGPKPVPDPAQGDGGVSAFYTWDKQVPATPGRLLRQEPLPEILLLENASKGLRVLYTSTDGVGGKTPIAASGAMFVPKGPAPAGGWPIIAWAHGTT